MRWGMDGPWSREAAGPIVKARPSQWMRAEEEDGVWTASFLQNKHYGPWEESDLE